MGDYPTYGDEIDPAAGSDEHQDVEDPGKDFRDPDHMVEIDEDLTK